LSGDVDGTSLTAGMVAGEGLFLSALAMFTDMREVNVALFPSF
jgi:hypothetical protein